MEVCHLMVEKAPFGDCNDCYTSVDSQLLTDIQSRLPAPCQMTQPAGINYRSDVRSRTI